MQRIRKAIRTAILYIASVALIAGAPLSVFADDTVPTPSGTTTSSETTPSSDTSQPTAPDATTQPADSQPPAPETQTEATPTPTKDTPTTVAPTTEPASAPTASSPDTVQPTTQPTTTTDVKNTVTIENTEHSSAQSGDATVKQNTKAGDATTGSATAQTTTINSVQSSVTGGTSSVAHFTTDIYGNVYGDITISPSINAATQAQNANMSNVANLSNDDTITNNVTASATSGNATVDSNTTAGNATTGNANAVANILNLINTIIAANQSFVGTINIYGDLNGDILVSPEFIPQLLAANQGSSNANTLADLNSNQQIVNNIQLEATSGSANVAQNTTAGSATTGNAVTNLTVLNLTGHQVTAANSLLVFVNVLGKWVGMIVDAPAGATSALLGSGVTNNTLTAGSTVNMNDAAHITNNVDLSAVSGDAAVTRNTTAGSATSGNATASANIANIAMSTFSLSNWFGVLFINVFGTWEGSFGINTANGNIIPLSGDAVAPAQPSSTPAPNFHFGFTPKATSSHNTLSTALSSPVVDSDKAASPVTATLASHTIDDDGPAADQSEPTTLSESPRTGTFDPTMMYAGFGLVVIGLLIAGWRRAV